MTKADKQDTLQDEETHSHWNHLGASTGVVIRCGVVSTPSIILYIQLPRKILCLLVPLCFCWHRLPCLDLSPIDFAAETPRNCRGKVPSLPFWLMIRAEYGWRREAAGGMASPNAYTPREMAFQPMTGTFQSVTAHSNLNQIDSNKSGCVPLHTSTCSAI